MHRTRDRQGPRAVKPSLRADQSGMALIYVTLLLPVIIAFALLAVDASRLYILSSSLQHGADSIALSMAAELDRNSDSWTRADRAKDNLVANPATFTSTFTTINGSAVTRRFLKALPPSDATPINSSYVATTPAETIYVEVTVKPAQFDTIFPASFINAVGSFTTQAVAVAGLNPGACNIVPMFICNPLETASNTNPYRVDELLTHIGSQANKRKLFELKAFANNQPQYSPGNFGYIETPLGKGARALNDAIAEANPGACITLNGLTTKPGNTAVTNNAFNVRFDLYAGPYNNKKNDVATRPARNTRKSYIAGNGQNGACNPSEITDLYTNTAYTPNGPARGMGFPRDSCLVTGTCGTGYGGRIGGGDWNNMYTVYMRANFGTNPQRWPKRVDGSSFPNDSSVAANIPTRYDVYRGEIASGFVDSATAGNNTARQGMAYPACYTGGTLNDLPDRRLILVAIANCNAIKLGGGSTKINAAAFGLFFLTEPVGSTGSVFAELIDLIQPGAGSGTNGGLITDNVQLFR